MDNFDDISNANYIDIYLDRNSKSYIPFYDIKYEINNNMIFGTISNVECLKERLIMNTKCTEFSVVIPRKIPIPINTTDLTLNIIDNLEDFEILNDKIKKLTICFVNKKIDIEQCIRKIKVSNKTKVIIKK